MRGKEGFPPTTTTTVAPFWGQGKGAPPLKYWDEILANAPEDFGLYILILVIYKQVEILAAIPNWTS